MEVELGYPVPGCVCPGCLVDQPAFAMVNTRQARDFGRMLKDPFGASLIESQFGPVIGPAVDAMVRAEHLCNLVRIDGRAILRGMSAGLLTVCSCGEVRIVKLEFGCAAPGEACTGCGKRLPSFHWLDGGDASAYVEEMVTAMEYRQALKAARGAAPIVSYPGA